MEDVPFLYAKKLPIFNATKRDLLSLCKDMILPEEVCDFYRNITSSNINDHAPVPTQDEEKEYDIYVD